MSESETAGMYRPKAVEERVLIRERGRIIFEQDFIGRDGKVDLFGPLFASEKQAVIGLSLTADNKVVAIWQFRYGANDFVLEHPGGNPKSGQSFEECLFDELAEETGYQPEKVVILSDKGIWIDPASLRIRFIPALALGCKKVSEPTPDRTEIIKVVEIPFEEWLERIEAGEIEDAKTLVVTFLTKFYLEGISKGLVD